MNKTVEAVIKLKIDLETGKVTGNVQLANDLEKEVSAGKKDFIEDKIIASWDEIKEYIKVNLGLTNLSYNVWIKPIKIARIENATIYLKNLMVGEEEYIEKRYFLCFQGAILNLFKERYRFAFE